jgi:putative SOS response-associated peptidase YedK
MCGRFTLTTDAETIAQYFALSDVPSVSPRYNIAPTQPVLVIVRDEKTKTKFCRRANNLIILDSNRNSHLRSQDFGKTG